MQLIGVVMGGITIAIVILLWIAAALTSLSLTAFLLWIGAAFALKIFGIDVIYPWEL